MFLFIEHDCLPHSDLGQRISTNTHYLSQHFRQQGLTYNSYINCLRIQHFISLYQEAAKTKHVVSASELASNESNVPIRLSYYCDKLHRIFTINWINFDAALPPIGKGDIYQPAFVK